MRLFKRWTSGLFSRIDWMVAQVENQEALVGNAIGDVQQAAARAKVQLARVRRDGERLRDQLAEEQAAETQWKERAKKSADSDETRALECLRRSKRATRRVSELRRRLADHERTERQLAKDVCAVEERLAELKEKRNLMRTRESRAEAMSATRGADAPLDGAVEEVFDRWEMRVTEVELDGGCGVDGDAFEDHFATAEEEEDLRAELAELRATTE